MCLTDPKLQDEAAGKYYNHCKPPVFSVYQKRVEECIHDPDTYSAPTVSVSLPLNKS